MSAAPVEAPTPSATAVRSWAWHLLQVSSWLLALMVPVHVVATWVVHDPGQFGVATFVDRWGSTGWRVFDWALVVLALLHGGIGANGVVAARLRSPRARTIAAASLAAGLGGLAVVVSAAVFSFDRV